MTPINAQKENNKYESAAENICRYVLESAINYQLSNKDSSHSNPVDDLAFLASISAYVQTHLQIAHNSGTEEEKKKAGHPA